MTILAIDPGPAQSAVVLWSGTRILHALKAPNPEVRELVMAEARKSDVGHVVCERIASYGMSVGREVFETCFWSGRFWECVARLGVGVEFHLIERREVKMHLCGQARAKDTNIRQALVDRFGDKGTKKSPGLTYGLKADTWQAFALAVTCHDQPSLLRSE